MNKSAGPVLVVGAHPDDEVLGAGGAIARHAASGAEVHILLVTEGSTQQYDDPGMVEQKREEAQTCADRLGVTEVHFGDLPDMKLDQTAHVECNRVISDVVETVAPQTVYTHAPHEVNLDHRAVYESTMVATRPTSHVTRVLTYEVPSSTDWVGGDVSAFQPNVYVDITEHLETKVEAFQAYDSERRDFPHPRSERAMRARARTRGTEAGFGAAEAFSLVKEYRS